jgi:transposase
MAYRQAERQQRCLFPQSIEEYISPDDPVRAYDAFVETLDLERLGMAWNPQKVGCPQYDPMVMLKILVYGYSYGIRSSRKLERALYHNLSFIWLAGALKPDHKTISRFRRENRNALKQVLKECARLCMELDLIGGNTLFVDGSKLRANASLNNLWTSERCQRYLVRLDQRIDEILSECDHIDQREAEQGSMVHLNKELNSKQKLKAKVQKALDKLQSEGVERFNTTDPECARMHGRQGSHAGYNAQIVVDDQHGLILHSDVVNDNNDRRQFADQVEAAQEILGEPCQVACADSGYYSGDVLEKVDKSGIKVVVPSQEQVTEHQPGPFDKSRFMYIAREDVYVCPAGHKLPYRRTCMQRRRREYQLAGVTCRRCGHFGVCTKSRHGRKVTRFINEDLRERLRAEFEGPGSQQIYSRRKEKVELPFGHIKRNLGVDSFLLRGLAGVRAEMSILGSCFNIRRLISLFGVSALVTKLSNQ